MAGKALALAVLAPAPFGQTGSALETFDHPHIVAEHGDAIGQRLAIVAVSNLVYEALDDEGGIAMRLATHLARGQPGADGNVIDHRIGDGIARQGRKTGRA